MTKTTLLPAFQWLKKLEYLGYSPDMESEEVKKLLYVNRATMLTFLIMQAYSLYFFISGFYSPLKYTLSLSVGWLFIFLFNYLKYHKTARFYTIFIANLTIFLVTWLYSTQSGMQFFFLPAAFACMLLFNADNLAAILVSAVSPCVLYWVTSSYFNGDPYLTELKDSELLNVLSSTSFIICILISILYAYFYSYQSLVANRKMADAYSELEKANAVKEKFISVISHELRTPLSAIEGYSSILKDRLKNSNEWQMLEKISKSNEKLLSLLDDIIHYTEVSTGQLHIDSEVFNLKTLFEELAEMFNEEISAKKLKLSVQLDENLNLCYAGKVRLLRIMLSNLLSNAIKFTPSGEICLKAQQMATDNNVHRVKFQITDTGIGLNLAELPVLFQEFTQSQDELNRNEGGIGLGLAIVKHISTLLDTSLTVESNPGKGSSFSFILSLETTQIPAPTASKTIRNNNESLHVLVVEDNYFNAEIVKTILQSEGHHVTVAENGLIANRFCHQSHYDFIFMDIQMPECDGIEATKLIRSSGLNTETPIVALTANTESNTRVKALQAGMNDYMNKPVKKEQLLEMINTLLV